MFLSRATRPISHRVGRSVGPVTLCFFGVFELFEGRRAFSWFRRSLHWSVTVIPRIIHCWNRIPIICRCITFRKNPLVRRSIISRRDPLICRSIIFRRNPQFSHIQQLRYRRIVRSPSSWSKILWLLTLLLCHRQLEAVAAVVVDGVDVPQPPWPQLVARTTALRRLVRA